MRCHAQFLRSGSSTRVSEKLSETHKKRPLEAAFPFWSIAKYLIALDFVWWPGAESKDSLRLAPALNLANSSLLPGYTFAHAKPVSGD